MMALTVAFGLTVGVTSVKFDPENFAVAVEFCGAPVASGGIALEGIAVELGKTVEE
jgi:hypothetical protein